MLFVKQNFKSAGKDQLVGGEGPVQEVYSLILTQEIENESHLKIPWVPSETGCFIMFWPSPVSLVSSVLSSFDTNLRSILKIEARGKANSPICH